MDDQVKVRGFRIELGEIDHAMRALPWVRDAAAVLQGSTRGEVAITAFVVPSAQDHPIDASLTAELRNSLRDRLPEYMLPSRVIPLERLPVNGNGKTDRRALGSMAAGSGGGPAQPAR
jgi:acyl-coenzyme A synthetase/AMP-(fatty) acid ligase